MSRALEIAQEVDDWFAEEGNSYSRKAWHEKFYTLARADLVAENATLWADREEPLKQVALYLSECNRLERERDAAIAENAKLRAALKDTVVALDHLQNVLHVRVNPPTLDVARAALGENE